MYESAEWYSKASEDHQRESQWALDIFWDQLSWKSEENILDIGCGSGDVTHNVLLNRLSKHISALIGIDMSEKMIGYAKGKWRSPKLSFKQINIADSDILSGFSQKIQDYGGFDKIFSFFCLQWVKDRKQLAKNLKSLLLPGGEGILLMVVRSGIYQVWDCMARRQPWAIYLPDIEIPLNDYVYMDDPYHAVSEILQNAGLVVKNWRMEERKKAFTTNTDNVEEKKGRLRTVDPLIAHLPDHQKESYLAELWEMTQRAVSPRGATDYTALVLHIAKPLSCI